MSSQDSAKARRFLLHLEPLQGALEAYCRRNLNDPNAIEDALQSVVANAFRDFDLYAEGTNFRAWIFRYLNLEILSRNRRGQKQPSSLREEVATGESWEKAVQERIFEELQNCPEAVLEHFDEVLADALRSLDPLQRSAFLLRAIGEFKYREIAEILEVPIGTVMSDLARGRARLRASLVDDCRQRGWLKHEP